MAEGYQPKGIYIRKSVSNSQSVGANSTVIFNASTGLPSTALANATYLGSFARTDKDLVTVGIGNTENNSNVTVHNYHTSAQEVTVTRYDVYEM